MIGALYIEEGVAAHPRVRRLVDRFPQLPQIPCRHYGEVFNRRAQSFRLQKRRPALILAEKRQHLMLEAPVGYGIGGRRSFYFSHLLNCPFDCRYCFLQGMYRSAHYVLFVNYEDFFTAAAATAGATPGEATTFFSGYDADSLALEPLTGFVGAALEAFRGIDDAWLELRTKSTQTTVLHEHEPSERCIVAASLTPAPLSAALEHGVPAVGKRLRALARLGERGWPLGLRFDPLIYDRRYRDLYRGLFEEVFATLDAGWLHSVSLGPFRLPRPFFRRIERLYPEEPLLAGPLEDRDGLVSYRRELEEELVTFCTERILRWIPEEIFFPCVPTQPEPSRG